MSPKALTCPPEQEESLVVLRTVAMARSVGYSLDSRAAEELGILADEFCQLLARLRESGHAWHESDGGTLE